MDLFVPPAKRDKDQITIRDDIGGGIKVPVTHFCVKFPIVIVHEWHDALADFIL